MTDRVPVRNLIAQLEKLRPTVDDGDARAQLIDQALGMLHRLQDDMRDLYDPRADWALWEAVAELQDTCQRQPRSAGADTKWDRALGCATSATAAVQRLRHWIDVSKYVV